MKANKDPQIQVKDSDIYHYHVEHTRIIVDQTGKYPETNKRIQIYSKKDYNDLFGKGGFIARHGKGATNDDEFRVVHDPIFQKDIEEKGVVQAEKNRLAAEKATKTAKEKKPKAKTESSAEKKKPVLN